MGEDEACNKAILERVKEFPYGPREAVFWKGLAVHVDREEVDYGGEIGKRDVLVIDGFNGIEGGGGGKAAGSTKKAAKKAAGTTKKAAASSGGLTDEIKAKLDEIADASADHDSFMEAAFAQVPEASADDAVKAAVGDNGEGSLWAEAVTRYEATQG